MRITDHFKSIIIILVLPISLIGQGHLYYPMHVGNFWQYNFSLPEYSTYSITRAGVVDTVRFDGDLWYSTYLDDINYSWAYLRVDENETVLRYDTSNGGVDTLVILDEVSVLAGRHFIADEWIQGNGDTITVEGVMEMNVGQYMTDPIRVDYNDSFLYWEHEYQPNLGKTYQNGEGYITYLDRARINEIIIDSDSEPADLGEIEFQLAGDMLVCNGTNQLEFSLEFFPSHMEWQSYSVHSIGFKIDPSSEYYSIDIDAQFADQTFSLDINSISIDDSTYWDVADWSILPSLVDLNGPIIISGTFNDLDQNGAITSCDDFAVRLGFFNVTTSIDDDPLVPKVFGINSIFPNPSNSGINIILDYGGSLKRKLEVFNLLGELVYEKSISPVGEQNVYFWNGSDIDDKPVNSGIYIVKVSGDDIVDSKKLIILK